MSDKYRSENKSRCDNYASRYKSQPSIHRYEHMNTPYEYGVHANGIASGVPEEAPGYYSRGKSGYAPHGPPRSYQGRQDYDYNDPRERRGYNYPPDMPQRRASRFDEKHKSPDGGPHRQHYQSYDSPYDRRREFNQAPEDMRDRRELREDYRQPNVSRTDPYSPKRTDRRNYNRSPGKSSRFSIEPEADPRDPRSDDIIEDSVFVSNLPFDVTINELATIFGSIGLIKTDKRTGLFRIKLYNHPDGKPKGEASVCYSDVQAARAAVDWFNHTPLRGNTLNVQMAERTYSVSYTSGRGGRGNFRYGGKSRDDRGGHFRSNQYADVESGSNVATNKPPTFAQPGDWLCTSCKNNNFSWRTECNRCQSSKPESQDEPFHRSSPGRVHPPMDIPQGSGYRYR